MLARHSDSQHTVDMITDAVMESIHGTDSNSFNLIDKLKRAKRDAGYLLEDASDAIGAARKSVYMTPYEKKKKEADEAKQAETDAKDEIIRLKNESFMESHCIESNDIKNAARHAAEDDAKESIEKADAMVREDRIRAKAFKPKNKKTYGAPQKRWDGVVLDDEDDED
jgi:hypothetical protein